MSEATKKGFVPVLRFPEFRDAEWWKKKQLAGVCKMQAGKFVSASEIKEKEIVGLHSCYGGNGLRGFTKTHTHTGKYSLIGRQGALCGNITLATGKFHATEHAVVVTPNKGVDTDWLFYMLGYLNLNQYATGQAQPGLSVENLEKISINIPEDEKEQQKIAECLSSIDELVTAQTQKIEALKAHKKGLMQRLFPAEGETIPKLRFLEFSGEWKLKKIGDFIESYKGGAALTPSDFSSSSDCQVIPKKAITEGGWLKIDNEKPTYCNEDFYKNNLQYVVDSSYLITTLRDLVPSGPSIGYIVKYVGNINYILAQGVYGLKPKKTFISDFLIHFSNSDIYRKMMQSVMVGSTQVHIRNSTYLGLPICVPSLEEQQKIANCLTSIEDLITTQTQKLAALKAHKKGLMQQLFPNVEERE